MIAMSITNLMKTALALSALEAAVDTGREVLTIDSTDAVEHIGQNLLATIPLELTGYISAVNLDGDILSIEFIESLNLNDGMATTLRIALEQAVTAEVMHIATGNDAYAERSRRLFAGVKHSLKGHLPVGTRRWYF